MIKRAASNGGAGFQFRNLKKNALGGSFGIPGGAAFQLNYWWYCSYIIDVIPSIVWSRLLTLFSVFALDTCNTSSRLCCGLSFRIDINVFVKHRCVDALNTPQQDVYKRCCFFNKPERHCHRTSSLSHHEPHRVYCILYILFLLWDISAFQSSSHKKSRQVYASAPRRFILFAPCGQIRRQVSWSFIVKISDIFISFIF